MTHFFQYLLLVNIVFVNLYALYWFFYRKWSFHVFNRIYLLLIMGISMGLPLLLVYILKHIQVQLPVPLIEGFAPSMESNLDLELVQLVHSSQRLDVQQIFLSIYGMGVLVLIYMFLKQISSVFKILRNSEWKSEAGVKVHLSEKVKSPFSFFQFIFIPKSYLEHRSLSFIVTHEKAHVTQKHSWDIMLVHLFIMMNWFNPLVYFFRKTVKENHEFLADQEVCFQGSSKIDYMNLLLETTISPSYSLQVVHRLFSVKLKNRIKMMTKLQTKKHHAIKYLYTFPLIIFLSWVSSAFIIIPQEPPSILPIVKESFIKVSSGFGMRKHPISKEHKLHRGIDLPAAMGTKVLATSAGKVVKIDFAPKGYGHFIVLQHDQVYQTVYAQLSKVNVEENEMVEKGQVIGLVGSSGTSTGPHLHYEVLKDGEYVDPKDYIQID